MLTQTDINKRLKSRIVIFVMVAVGTALFLASVALYRSQVRLKRVHEEKLISENTSILESRLTGLSGDINYISNNFRENIDIIQPFHHRNQKLLSANVTDLQQKLKEKYPFKFIINFYLPEYRLFLSPDSSGNILNIPPQSLVRKAIEKKSTERGYKVVNNELYFKIVSPVFHNGSFSGVIELGLRDIEIIEYLESGSDFFTALYFPKSLFPVIANFQPDNTVDLNNLCLKPYNYEELFREFLGNNEIPERKPANIDNKNFIIENRGLVTAESGVPLGGLIIAHDATEIKSIFNRNILAVLILSPALFVIAYISAMFFTGKTVAGFNNIQRKKLENLGEKTEKITGSAIEPDDILNSTATAIRVINKDFKIIRINKSYAKLFGLNPDKIIGKKCYSYWPEPRCHKESCPVVRLKNGEKLIEEEVEKPGKTAGKITGIQTCTPVYDETGTLKGMVEDFRDITCRKKAEEALEKSERQFRHFMDDLPLGIFIKDEKSRPLYHNRYMDEVFCKKNCTGKKPHELFPGITARLERAEDKRAIAGENIVVEKILTDKNGRERIYMVHKFSIKDPDACRIGGIYIDITKRKEAEYKLRILSRAIRYSPVCVVITDPEGKIEFVNPAFTNITGYSFAEVMGRNMNILNSGKHPADFFKKMWKSIKSGKDWQGEILNKKKNGTLYWEKVAISAIINNKGDITHFVAIKNDVTRQKEAEEEIRRAKEKAEDSDRLKTAFLANMSHEIRTPMNAIVGLSKLLVDTEISLEERKSFTNIINDNSQALLKLIEDIIDVSKIEAGQISINKGECLINKLLDEIHGTFKTQIQNQGNRNIVLSVHKELDDRNATIITDPHRLRQILVNLVGNSYKFTREGSIEFGYEREGDDKLRFFVKDTGIGISKEKAKVIFNRFRQGEDSSKRNYGGAGLGLTISKSLVEMLGGEIWVESTPGLGATFHFNIPYIHSGSKGASTKVVQITRDRKPVLKGKTIVVAEDVEANFRLIEALLKKTHATVLWARDGAETLEICRKNKKIDLVLLDINMPRVNGYEVLVEIKKMKHSIPVIMQTAYAMPGEEERFISAGCDGYLTKPINTEEMFNSIRKCLIINDKRNYS